MRLSEEERTIIKKAIHSVDPTADIFLFGSRVADEKRGGDIDILIFSKVLKITDKPTILNHIFKKLEEQKIDLVIAKDDSDPFVRIAMRNAVHL